MDNQFGKLVSDTSHIGLPSCNYVYFWLTVIMSGVVDNDVGYFKGPLFEQDYGRLPDKYFAQALGVHRDVISFEMVRDLLVERAKCYKHRRSSVNRVAI